MNQSLQRLGARLIVRRATQSLPALEQILAETGADALYWNTRYEPQLWERDGRVHKTLRARGIETREFPSYLLHDPNAVRTDAGQSYTVFTPFWKRMLQVVGVPDPLPAPETLRTPERMPASEPLESLGLLPTIDWAAGFRATWQVGEAAAHRRLEWFLRNAVEDYHTLRDRPDLDATSRLSPHLQHRRDHPAPDLARHPAPQQGQVDEGRGAFPARGRLARVRLPHPVPPPLHPDARPAVGVRLVPVDGGGNPCLQSVDARAHRHPDGGRGDAPAVAHRLDAQPHTHDCRLVADQKPAAGRKPRARPADAGAVGEALALAGGFGGFLLFRLDLRRGDRRNCRVGVV